MGHWDMFDRLMERIEKRDDNLDVESRLGVHDQRVDRDRQN